MRVRQRLNNRSTTHITVSVAVLLVTVPYELVTWTLNIAPLSALVVGGVV